MNEVLNALPIDFDLVFLGGQDQEEYTRPANQYDEFATTSSPTGETLTWVKLNSNHLNTTSAYVISRKGAVGILRLLRQHLDRNEPLTAIDGFLRQSSDFLDSYEIQTHIFHSPWDSPESDIRFPGFHESKIRN